MSDSPHASPSATTTSAPSTAYLTGEHTPVVHELDVKDLEVRGQLPAGLRGMFVRNSPNPRFAPLGRYHWFDGDGMVHGVGFGDGDGGKPTARYVNKWIQTAGLRAESDAGAALWTGILEPARPGGPKIPLKDTANTDLIVHRGRLYATWWMAGTPYELDVTDLSTKGPERFGGKLTGGFSAHPKVDPRTGEMVFFDFNLMKPPFLRYGVISAAGELVRYEPIDIPAPHILHDCALTETSSILLDLPLGWDMAALMAGKRKIKFHRDQPARFGVLPRHGDNSSVQWFDVESCYVYHMINAYDDGDEVVLVGCRVRDLIPATPTRDASIARLDTIELQPLLHEWRLNRVTGGVKERALDDVPTEFPRTNDRLLGTRLRYSYNPRIARRSDVMFDGVIKYDLDTGASQTCSWEPGWFGSEVVFVPNPAAAGGIAANSEDDGWLVTILTKDGEASKAVVVDAADVAAGPIASVTLPQQVPIGFHAAFVPA